MCIFMGVGGVLSFHQLNGCQLGEILPQGPVGNVWRHLEQNSHNWEGRVDGGPHIESELKQFFFFLPLTGAVSLSGTDSGLWAVEGGNKLVCSGLLKASKSNLISGSVMSIEEKTRTKEIGKL